MVLGLLLTGCQAPSHQSTDQSSRHAITRARTTTTPVKPRVISGHPVTSAVTAARQLFTSAPAAVIAPDGNQAAQTTAASTAIALGIPMLLAGKHHNQPVAAELDRLKASTVITYDRPAHGWQAITTGRKTVTGPTSTTGLHDLTRIPTTRRAVSTPKLATTVADLTRSSDRKPATLLHLPAKHPSTTPDTSDTPSTPTASLPPIGPSEKTSTAIVVTMNDPQSVPGIASARAAGAEVRVIPSTHNALADPRARAAATTLRRHKTSSVIALGQVFGPAKTFRHRVDLARATKTPGLCEQLIYPQCRMVALYGHPGTPSLGVLGRQDKHASIDRAKKLARQYQKHSAEPVKPALEYIATIASSAPGPDGTYSTKSDPDDIIDWVKTAQKAGVYVVLDLQPGRADFLTQAKRYKKALEYPNVGLALDAEWRLKPDQKPLQQIGSVDIDEVNSVITWLADLTEHKHLPQKVLTLHQFRLSMIHNREDLITNRDSLALTIHADGNGTPEMKMGTWNALQTRLPPHVWMGWKNFYEKDTPTFTPHQTMNLTPQPWFTSYQ